MSEAIAIAVVIPTYNRSTLVKRAIKSVIGQTEPASEIIVVNDGSGDNTLQVLSAFPTVRVIDQPNGGLSSARNAGIEAASADWIALLDDDDWYVPEILQGFGDRIRGNPDLDLLYAATCRVDGSGKDLGLSHRGHRLPENPLAALASENFVLSSAVCVRRKTLLAAGLFDPTVRLCEDQDLWLRVASLGARFGYIDRPLAYITRQPGSMSASGERMARATIDVLERRADCLTALNNGSGSWWLANAHYRLGRVFWERQDWEAARLEFSISLKLDKSHKAAKLYLWSSLHPGTSGVFVSVRKIKRRLMFVLHKAGLAESRWGSQEQ